MLLLAAGAAGCGDDEPSATERRADQVADAATDAGLARRGRRAAARPRPRASTAPTARPTTSPAPPAARRQHVTVTQRPPDRRLDITRDDGSADATIAEDGANHQCTKPAGDGGEWSCELLSEDAAAPSGLFDADAVGNLTTALTAGAADYVFTVEDRELVGVDARCLVTRRAIDAPDDPALGAEADAVPVGRGARLLTEVPSGTLRATAYETSVADDAFDLPATVPAPGDEPPEQEEATTMAWRA